MAVRAKFKKFAVSLYTPKEIERCKKKRAPAGRRRGA